MSGLINKAKDMMSGNKSSSTEHGTTGHDTTSHTSGGYGNTGSEHSGAGSHLAGHTSNTGTTGTTGAGYGSSGNQYDSNTGPHSSGVANRVDPRVDSDRDNRGDPTSRVGGYGGQDNYGSSTRGPGHQSGAQTGYGGQDTYGSSTGGQGLGSSTTTGAGYGGQENYQQQAPGHDSTTTSGAGYGSSTTSTGPHNSSMMNKMDPRVDSDRDNRGNPTSRVGGYGDQDTKFGEHQPGGVAHHANSPYGNDATMSRQQHHTGAAPNYGQGDGVPGGLQGQNVGEYGSGMHGTGHQQGGDYSSGTGAGYGQQGSGRDEYSSAGTGKSTNAGPHNSNLMNKLDPRVDSDQSGGKTYGGNATHQ